MTNENISVVAIVLTHNNVNNIDKSYSYFVFSDQTVRSNLFFKNYRRNAVYLQSKNGNAEKTRI